MYVDVETYEYRSVLINYSPSFFLLYLLFVLVDVVMELNTERVPVSSSSVELVLNVLSFVKNNFSGLVLNLLFEYFVYHHRVACYI